LILIKKTLCTQLRGTYPAQRTSRPAHLRGSAHTAKWARDRCAEQADVRHRSEAIYERCPELWPDRGRAKALACGVDV